MNINIVSPAFNQKDFEDRKILRQIDAIFITKRKHAFQLPKQQSSVVLLISGGLDSICLWNILLSKYKLHVYPVHFLNNYRILKGEEISTRYYENIFKHKYPKYFHTIKFIRAFSTNRVNALTSTDMSNDITIMLNNLLYSKVSNSYRVSVTYNSNPLYNYFFNAYIYAQHLRATIDKKLNTLLVSFVPEDTMLSRNSTLTVMRGINLNLCLILGDFSWQFTAAFEPKKFYLPRKILIAHALKNNISLGRSWSCMKNGNKQCGICGPCVIRKNAFRKLHLKDTTVYENNSWPYISLRSRIKKILFACIDNVNALLFHTHITLDNPLLKRSCYIISSNVSWQEIEGKIHLLHKKKGEIDVLNESASLLWKNIAHKKQSFSSLYAILKKHYEIGDKKLTRDLIRFLRKYVSEGYLQIDRK